MIGFVYMWINKINGKKYVGAHKGSFDDGYVGSGSGFKKAIEKYGIENFERVILYSEFDCEENLYKKEFEIINEMNAVFSSDYYNQTNFDPKFNHLYSGKRTKMVSDETRRKMSEIAKHRSKEWCEGQSRRMKERNPYHDKSVVAKMIETKRQTGTLNQSGSNNPMYGRRWYNNGLETTTFIPGTEPTRMGSRKNKGYRCKRRK